MTWAATNGILSGYTSATFGPEDTATRQQLVTALWRFEHLQNLSVDPQDSDLKSFRDRKAILPYAMDAFRWACGAGIVSGDVSHRLQPTKTVTRDQMAMILFRYSRLPKIQAETPAGHPQGA